MSSSIMAYWFFWEIFISFFIFIAKCVSFFAIDVSCSHFSSASFWFSMLFPMRSSKSSISESEASPDSSSSWNLSLRFVYSAISKKFKVVTFWNFSSSSSKNPWKKSFTSWIWLYISDSFSCNSRILSTTSDGDIAWISFAIFPFLPIMADRSTIVT